MANSFDSTRVPRAASLLWVNLTQETHTALGASVSGEFDVHGVREPAQISAAIQVHAPLFLCFEFDQPDAPGMAALAQIRCNHPNLPVLMITGGHSEALALWALRIRVWDLLVKPVSNSELSQRLTALIELTRQPGRGPARAIQFPRQVNEATAIPKSPGRRSRTHPAIAHEATHFDRKIALQDVAALCRLSPTQFCRVFRQEQAQASDSLCCTTGWSRRAKASPIQAHWPRKSPKPSASTISRISRGRSNGSSA